MTNAARFVCLALIASLAACGGGSSGAVPSIPTNLVALDGANAQGVTGAVVRVSDTTYNFGKTGSAVVGGVSVSALAQAFSLAKLAQWQLLMLKGMASPLSVTGVGTLASNKAPCDNNQGTVTVTNSTVGDNSAPTVGDSYSVSFAGCFIKDTQSTLNGSLTMSIVSFTGDPLTDPSWSMAATFKFANLSSTGVNGASTLSGGYSFTLTTGDSITYNGIIQSDSFTETRGQLVEGLRKLAVNYSVDSANQEYTLSLHGLYGSTDLNGAVNFDSETPFDGIGKDWPNKGKLKVSGAGNTSVTLLTVSNNSVQLGVDSTGDGVADNTLSANWVSLVTS